MSRCGLCPGKNKCVAGDGPETCGNYYFLGEAPGRDEDKKGVPFIGKTGREVNEGYLPLTGLRRSGVRFNNAISCLPDTPKGKLDSKKSKDRDLLKSCAEHHLYPELERLKPKLIVPMGVFACMAVDPSIDLELQHGIPLQTVWGDVFPMYHPAGGIHEPKKMLHIRTDWTRLRKYMIGKLRLPVDRYKGQEQYEEITSCAHLKAVLDGCNDYTMACDTEVKRGGLPFCLTFSIYPGSGYLIRAERWELLSLYQEYLEAWEGPILWHNWLFDSAVVAKMGLHYLRRLIKDTMVMVFHLGNLPQGLKALSYRELGMQMQDFDDLVSPYSTPLVLDYYRAANVENWARPPAEMIREGEIWKLYQPQSLSTKLKRFFTDYAKNEDKDVFKAWENWDCADMVEAELGPWPGKCISHVPFEKVLHYACRDADALLRLYPLLKYMRHNVRKRPQENWIDGYIA